mgnify:CR=1 FL=1
MKQDDPRQTLGIGTEADDETIRAAYLRKVKEFPPDRAPVEFEKIRDAYDAMRDPARRAIEMLTVADPACALQSLLEDRNTERIFAGPAPWLAVLKERKRQ